MSSDDRFVVWCLAATTCQLFRVSVDAIQSASQSTSKDFQETHHSVGLTAGQDESANELTSLVGSRHAGIVDRNPLWQVVPSRLKASIWSFRVQCLMCVGIAIDIGYILYSGRTSTSRVLPLYTSWVSLGLIASGAWLTVRDLERRRLGFVARVGYLLGALLLWLPLCLVYSQRRQDSTMDDEVIINITGLYCLLAVMEVCFLDFPTSLAVMGKTGQQQRKERTLPRSAMLTLLKPYFWPDQTSDSAMVNRLRAILTWVCVILSKVCNLLSPMAIGRASTALAHQDYKSTILYSIAYAVIQFMGSVFNESQSLIYLKVAQAAFVQLSETTFAHLHGLSLDWHLRKKLGEVIRGMDRGIAACDTLMKYLFLWLIPALGECVTVCIIFATYFNYAPLGVSVFYFVWLYIVWTILVTLWRKKFRNAVVQSDNEWHDRCTDSLLNFETVKYFTAEDYEARRFGEAVRRYQAGSIAVQASLSFLNVSQKIILQMCLATALSLSVLGIQKRSACCLELGCESPISDCCRAAASCSGMQVGDFVAVLTYVVQLFSPLNFLGTIYNAVVMAMIDLTNLSELLAEEPDVTDAPDAVLLPSSKKDDPDTAVEFDNVYFHYPSQPSTKGLKGLSFKMKRGTTTAIVGATGEGKTTVSRLLFRFYDVLGGAVKINGVDVRMVKQRSLRDAIGAVAQQSGLFSDTIRANIRYGRRDATDAELVQAAKDAQLLTFIESLDEGWDSMVGDRGLKLSGGERQRASIARCLLKDPPFVILDEATSALDTLTENSVQEALERLGSERTVLVIAHRLGTIRNADNIVVLKNGVAAEQGTHDQLLELNGIYAEMWTMQLHSNAGSQVLLAALNE